MRNNAHDWFLAQVKPNGLQLAVRNLERQKVVVFSPVHKITKREKGKFVTRKQPLFPGYLFVGMDAQKGHWRTVNSTRGITKLVSFGDEPALVPHDLILALAKREDYDANEHQVSQFQSGDSVKITQGPFADFLATVEQATCEQRTWLLLDILGRTTRISVDRQSIRAVKS